MTAYRLYNTTYDPGISPGSANQCIIGDMYLRPNISREHSMLSVTIMASCMQTTLANRVAYIHRTQRKRWSMPCVKEDRHCCIRFMPTPKLMVHYLNKSQGWLLTSYTCLCCCPANAIPLRTSSFSAQRMTQARSHSRCLSVMLLL